MLKSVEVRDVVAIHYDGAPHPAVILQKLGSLAVILISGTGQEHAAHKHIRLDHKKRVGKSMRLTKPTYFYGRNVRVASLSELSAWPNGKGKCPPDQTRMFLTFVKEWLAECHHADAQSLLSSLP